MSLSDADVDSLLEELFDEILVPTTELAPHLAETEDSSSEVEDWLGELLDTFDPEAVKPYVYVPPRLLSPEPASLDCLQEAVSDCSVRYWPTALGPDGMLNGYSASQLANGLAVRNETRYNKHALIPLPVENLAAHLHARCKAGEVLHEYVRGDHPLCLAVDFDAKQKELEKTPYSRDQAWDWLIHAFTEAAQSIYTTEDCLRYMSASTTNRATKMSVHIVLTGALVRDHHETRGFLELLKDHLPEDLACFVDGHTGQSQPGLRLLGCAKEGHIKVPTRDSIERGHTSLASYLIQPHGLCPPWSKVRQRLFSEEPEKAEKKLVELADKVVEAAVAAIRALMPELSLRDVDGGRIDLSREAPGHCPLCQREHEKDGAYAYAPDGEHESWRLYCRGPAHRSERPTPYYLDVVSHETDTSFPSSDESVSCDSLPAKIQKPTGPLAARMVSGKRIPWSKRLSSHIAARWAPLSADEAYAEGTMRPYPRDQRVLAVRAPCKTGKSVALREWLGDVPKDAIVVGVTHRVTFAAEVAAKAAEKNLPFVNYKDVQGDLVMDQLGWIVVQYESLHRLRGLNKGRPVYLVLDEYTSILRQMDSRLGRNKTDCQRMFRGLASMATRVVALDAYLDDGAIRVLARYTMARPYVIDNRARVHVGSIVRITPNHASCITNILEEVKKGTRVICAFDSKKRMKAVAEAMAQSAATARIEYRMKMYSSDTDDHEKARDFANVAEAWSGYDAILYTSTVEVGISFEIPRFTVQYGLFSNGKICAEAALQMIFRNRCVTDYRISLEYIPQGGVGATSVAGVLCDLQKADERAVSLMPEDVRCTMYIKDTEGTLGIGDTPRLDAYCYNRARANASLRAFHSIFIGWLCAWGMEVSVWECTTKEKAKATRASLKDIAIDIKIEDCSAVAEAPEISIEEYERLREQPKKTVEEKISLQAAGLRNRYHQHGVKLSAYWVGLWGDPKTIRAHTNLCEIRTAGPTGGRAVEALLRDAAIARKGRWGLISGTYEFTADPEKDKAGAVETELDERAKGSVARASTHANVHCLLEALGFKGLDDTETVLSTKQIDAAAKRKSKLLTHMRGKARAMFGVVLQGRDKKSAVDDSNSAIRMANSVLRAVYGMELDRAYRRMNGSREYCYALRPAEPFVNAANNGVHIPAWLEAPFSEREGKARSHDYDCEDVYL